MTEALPAYAVVTPVRDEAEHFSRTARSLVAQDHRPAAWVVVDDGSTDGTGELAARWAAEHPWIRVLRRDPGGGRARGAPIVQAFEQGRAAIDVPHEVVVKLDGDLHLPPHYFRWVAATFARVPRAGIVGGVAYVPADGRWRPDGAAHNVNGVAKAYRTTCLDDIGGLRASMGWDGIDEYAARARGWTVHVLSELQILHFRPRGTRQPWRQARWEEGLGNHFMGYRADFLAVRALFRMVRERPPVLGGAVLAAAYVSARLRRLPQVDDPAARALLRAEQRARLRLAARGRLELPAADLPDGGPAWWCTGREP